MSRDLVHCDWIGDNLKNNDMKRIISLRSVSSDGLVLTIHFCIDIESATLKCKLAFSRQICSISVVDYRFIRKPFVL